MGEVNAPSPKAVQAQHGDETTFTRDVGKHAQVVTRLVHESAMAGDAVTMAMLVKSWRSTKDVPECVEAYPPKELSPVECELIIVALLLSEVLQFRVHWTAYQAVAYVQLGRHGPSMLQSTDPKVVMRFPFSAPKASATRTSAAATTTAAATSSGWISAKKKPATKKTTKKKKAVKKKATVAKKKKVPSKKQSTAGARANSSKKKASSNRTAGISSYLEKIPQGETTQAEKIIELSSVDDSNYGDDERMDDDVKVKVDPRRSNRKRNQPDELWIDDDDEVTIDDDDEGEYEFEGN